MGAAASAGNPIISQECKNCHAIFATFDFKGMIISDYCSTCTLAEFVESRKKSTICIVCGIIFAKVGNSLRRDRDTVCKKCFRKRTVNIS